MYSFMYLLFKKAVIFLKDGSWLSCEDACHHDWESGVEGSYLGPTIHFYGYDNI